MRAIANLFLLSVVTLTACTPGGGGEDPGSNVLASPPASHPAIDPRLRTASVETPANFRVAFIGDQGLGGSSRAVLQLIKSEGARMVIHSGDFDYKNDPERWDDQITQVLGASFPYFASIGNHDVKHCSGYRDKLLQRLSRVEGASCRGDYGV